MNEAVVYLEYLNRSLLEEKNKEIETLRERIAELENKFSLIEGVEQIQKQIIEELKEIKC